MRQTRQTQKYTPQDIIASLNRSMDALNINGTPDTHEMASLNCLNCLKWLGDHFVRFHQTRQGLYVLDEMPTAQEEHGEKNEPTTTKTTERDEDGTINDQT